MDLKFKLLVKSVGYTQKPCFIYVEDYKFLRYEIIFHLDVSEQNFLR